MSNDDQIFRENSNSRNEDRNFQFKNESMISITFKYFFFQFSTGNQLATPTYSNNSQNLDIQNPKKRENQKTESVDEKEIDYFQKMKLETKQREDEKRKIQLEYQQELKRQIIEKEERMRKEKEELERRDKEELERARVIYLKNMRIYFY